MRVSQHDHTADVIVSAEGSSLEEVIENLVIGVGEIVWGVEDASQCCGEGELKNFTVRGDGPDMTFAQSSMLGEVLYLIETQKVLPCQVLDVSYSRKDGKVYVEVAIKGVKLNKMPSGEDVKAISFAMKWQVSVILDL